MVPVFVVLTILAFVAIDAWRERHRIPAISPVALPKPIDVSMPAGLFLHPSHAWAGILPSGKVEVGADSFLASAMGGLQEVSCTKPGNQVTKGEPVAQIRANGRELPLLSPVTGTVEQVNPNAGGDWICVISPTRLGSEIGNLMIAERAGVWLESEARRLASWLAGQASPVPALPDGGYPVEGVLAMLDSDTLKKFGTDFLMSPAESLQERG